MQLKDFFNFKDLIRVAFLGSALFFFLGTMYGVFLHAEYSTQVNEVKQDLESINSLMESRAQKAYSNNEGTQAREYKKIGEQAAELAKQIEAPPVSPSSYTYLNYWISSAAFTNLKLNYEILGLPEDTITVFNQLKESEVLNGKGWYSRGEFRGYDINSGEFKQYLEQEPELHSYFYTFYVFVLLISIITVFFGTKEKYEIPFLPEILYGSSIPAIPLVVFSVTGLLSLFGIVPFLHPTQVNVLTTLLAFVIMGVLSAFGAMIAAILRIRLNKIRL